MQLWWAGEFLRCFVGRVTNISELPMSTGRQAINPRKWIIDINETHPGIMGESRVHVPVPRDHVVAGPANLQSIQIHVNPSMKTVSGLPPPHFHTI